jgi:hypothetical protein
LRHDFAAIDEDTQKLLNISDDATHLFVPPFIPSAEKGVNETPLSSDPTENHKTLLGFLLDHLIMVFH